MVAFLSVIENEEERNMIGKIYEENYLKLNMIAKAIVKDESLAQDSVQDVFLKICDDMLERFLNLAPDVKLKYLIICVRHSALAKLNKRKRVSSLVVPLQDEHSNWEKEIEDDSTNVEEIILNKELKEKLRMCIDSLDEKYRDVVILKYEIYLKNKEIAERLYITEDAVKQRVKRAKQAIKEKGGKELYGLFH
ncbi:MAG: sigma-70 family RNA polymerase sigma factor [Clostridia bacterium]|nr:sigma-70 family RNA polymerase sigma factor [Clostridia bacterium]